MHFCTERALSLVEVATLNEKAKDKFKTGAESQLQKIRKKNSKDEGGKEEEREELMRKEKRNSSVTEIAQSHPQYPALDHRLEVAHTQGQGKVPPFPQHLIT